MIRDPMCSLCPLSDGLEQNKVCRTYVGHPEPELLVVTKNPFSKKALDDLIGMMEAAGLDCTTAFTSVIKCQVWDKNPTKAQNRICAENYLTKEVEQLKPKWILALGNEALTALTGKAQVTKYRAQVYNYQGSNVFPTLSPSAVKRNPGQQGGFIADLRFLAGLMSGQGQKGYKPDAFHLVAGTEKLKALAGELKVCTGYAFDIESNGFNEYEDTSKMVSLAVTTYRGDPSQGEKAHNIQVWSIPLFHPSSPFRGKWEKVLRWLSQFLKIPKKRIAHNGKFDLRWLNQFGVDIDLTFDTMLAAHLINENGAKGLKALAREILGVKPWDEDASDLLNTPIKRVLKYNGLDTLYTLHLYFHYLKELNKQPRLYKLMGYLMVPASNVFTEVESRGIWTDREKLATHAKIAKETLDDIDEQLMKHVPDRSIWPSNVKAVNFNASNFSRWWLFEYLEFPVLARGKSNEDTGELGKPSMAEGVLSKLQTTNPHIVLDLMLERVKWQKYHSAFFSSYLDQIDDNDRIHTTFKLTGTVTGRLSSGKGDEEKVSGKVSNRGVNLQQVPRDPFVKSVFGGGPGKVFLECDYSQIELRIAAFIAREDTLLGLYQNNQDVHMATAMQMTGKPASQVTSEERKKAKPVNFGFLYGMSANTFITTAWNNYGVEVTEDESVAFRKAFFTQFPKLRDWHMKQKRLARKYKRVESPLGRVRHLPDIDSPIPTIKAGAERQAINSPVQSFASDMAIMALVTLTREFRKRGLETRSVGTVHDAINFEVPIPELEVVAPLIKNHMENPPLEKWFGVHLDVPIVGDVALSKESWGQKEEIEGWILEDRDAWRAWLYEKDYLVA